MGCVNGCFEADGPDRSWSEMSWDLGRREKHHAKVKYLIGFLHFIFLSALVCHFLFLSQLFFFLIGRSFIELHHLHFIPFPPSQFLKRYILELLNQLFINSIILPSLAVFWSLLLFVFPSLPALSLLSFLYYWLSRDLFSSALYRLSSRLILSCCLALKLSGESLADCFSAWDQIITLQSLCQLFSSFLSLSTPPPLPPPPVCWSSIDVEKRFVFYSRT